MASAVQDSTCANCGFLFQKTAKGYKRRSLLNFTSPRTSKIVFPQFSPDANTFICTACTWYLEKNTTKTKGRGVRKRTYASRSPYKSKGSPTKSPGAPTTSTTSPTKSIGSPAPKRKPTRIKSESDDGPPPPPLPGPKLPSLGPKAQALSYLHKSKYLKLFRILLRIDAAKRDFIQCVSEVIHQERKELVGDKAGPFRKNVDLKVISEFSWESCLQWGEGKAPVILRSLRSMFPQAKHITNKHSVTEDQKRRSMTEAEAQGLIDKRIGLVLSVMLYTSNLHKINFVQKCLGVEFWRQGCSHKIFQTMNNLGITQSVVSARGHVDRMRIGHDEQVKAWKAAVEENPRGVKRKLSFGVKTLRGKSYSLTWDNVQLSSHVKHQHLGHENKFLLWALAFAHRNKVSFGHLHGEGQKAVDVPVHRILPTQTDYESLHDRMIIIVMRILSENLTALHKTKPKVLKHIPHKYTKQMEEKSTVVSLGVVNSNPSTTEGVLEIMDVLHKFVPNIDGEPYPILCCGDGLSVERMVHCREARLNGRNPQERLEGLVEAPQEFHKDMLLLQDTMNLLFKQKSISSRGTFSNLKGYFSHKSLKKNVKENVQHVWDFIEFVTSAYITSYATTLCGTNKVDQTPEGYPDKAEEQMLWLYNLAQQVVDFCWIPTEQEDIRRVASTKWVEGAEEAEIFPFCICEEEKEEQMVQCCSNLCGSMWFHPSCVDLEEVPEGDWYCSKACFENGAYVYCFCHEDIGGTMVQCQLMEKCKRYEWYHLDCLSPEAEDEIIGTWYCSKDCFYGAQGEDHVQNYSKAVLWEGLNNLARRDAVREGDGEAMTACWKMDMISFWNRRHPKYFILAHQMLTGIEGHLSERLQQDMTWNRVANLQGKPGGNVGLDLVNEFLNNEFKDMLKRSRGNYTEKQIDRCAQLSGAFGREVDRLFTEAGLGKYMSPTGHASSIKRYGEDIATFVAEFHNDALFDYLPGREHKGFEEFSCMHVIRDPKKIAHQMMRLAEDLDERRDLRDTDKDTDEDTE